MRTILNPFIDRQIILGPDSLLSFAIFQYGLQGDIFKYFNMAPMSTIFQYVYQRDIFKILHF